MWQGSRPYYLTDDEAEALQQAAELFLEGLPEAKEVSIQDRTLATPDAMLDLADYYRRQEGALQSAVIKMGEHRRKWQQGDQSA